MATDQRDHQAPKATLAPQMGTRTTDILIALVVFGAIVWITFRFGFL